MDAALNQTRMQLLGELAEMGMVLARDLQQSALMAEDLGEKVKLASAFHRIGRGVRQSLALHARLERDAEQAVREAKARASDAKVWAGLRRKSEIKGAVERLVWTEHEASDDEAETLIDRLDLLLDAEADAEGFLDEDPDLVIARLCEVLKLPVPPPSTPAGGGSRSEGGRAASGSEGEVSSRTRSGTTEGASAVTAQPRILSGPPQSVPDSSPEGRATDFHPSG